MKTALTSVVLLLSFTVFANEDVGRVELDETVISGNQELPKVLYILPWQEPGGLPELDLNSSLREVDVFRPLYPPAYRRELNYYRTLERVVTED